jgi:transcriptional regulator
MLSINNNDYHYTEREKKVLDLYNQGKNIRYIAKELRMSLRDISIISRKNQLSHGNIITKDKLNGQLISFLTEYSKTYFDGVVTISFSPDE